MNTEENHRVGAILRSQNGTVQLFGYGVLGAHEIPPIEAGGFNLGLPSVAITLDNGTKIFGCECWWASETLIKQMCANADKVEEVDVNEFRSRSLPLVREERTDEDEDEEECWYEN